MNKGQGDPLSNELRAAAQPTPRRIAALLAYKLEGVERPGDVSTERYYHWFRWMHWLILFGTVLLGACHDGIEGIDGSTYAALAVAGGISLFIELFYVGFNGWRISLTYILLATTYVAVLSGAWIIAFNVSRHLFGEPA
jgi:hypothetical protein